MAEKIWPKTGFSVYGRIPYLAESQLAESQLAESQLARALAQVHLAPAHTLAQSNQTPDPATQADKKVRTEFTLPDLPSD